MLQSDIEYILINNTIQLFIDFNDLHKDLSIYV